jgi:hypothetical protein
MSRLFYEKYKVKSLSIIVAVAILSSCASIEREVLLQVYNQEERTQQALGLGLELNADNFRQALKRWPDVVGNQLQRRALILSLKPDSKILAALDESRDPKLELSALQRLMNR